MTPRTLVPSILLVDDHPSNLLALGAVLEPLGMHLVRASSGKEALTHLLREEFAAIVLDVQMPDMDGFEVAALIRRRERTREVPIIFISAIHRDDNHQAKGYAHGAVDYLPKPFSPDVLRAKVSALADLWRRGEVNRMREAMQFERERAELLARERRAHTEAARSASVLDVVVGRAPIGIAIVDADLRCERINAPLAATSSGAHTEPHIGLPLAEVLPEGSDTVLLAERLRQVFATGEPLLNVEVGWQVDRRALANCYPVYVEGHVERVALMVVEATRGRAED
ncbi:response regulator [Polyangium mundeleinium]|uniref:Response regulator n=1 Tax=Polyangium mundeleinium TaxID=2995306 RepID=A0ABT5EKD9_9BACT|nr:response regulator [Polyangium mundeleinium]MDC0742303.1 response regulator [Polyangium mundeleinium]